MIQEKVLNGKLFWLNDKANLAEQYCPNCQNTLDTNGYCNDCHFQDDGAIKAWMEQYEEQIRNHKYLDKTVQNPLDDTLWPTFVIIAAILWYPSL